MVVPSDNLDMNDRDALRRDARRRRRAAAAADGGAAAQLAALFLDAVPWRDHRFASGYWPVGSELDDRPILHALSDAGVVVALPCVVAPGAALVFREWRKDGSLIDGAYDIPQPPASQPEVTPSIVVVPLLAFDDRGHRLGSGLGFYDRTLEALRREGAVLAVGVAYAAQRMARLQELPTDQPLDWLVTEEAAVRIT